MVALLVGIAIGGRYWSPLLLPKGEVMVAPEPGCDLQRGACTVALREGGSVELSITPRPIPVLAPLRVEVHASGLNASKIEIDFAGETMNMGYNRVALTRGTGGRYTGEASLPVCVSGGMNWTVTLLVETDRHRIAVPYRLAIGS